jgi:hypothetical protein
MDLMELVKKRQKSCGCYNLTSCIKVINVALILASISAMFLCSVHIFIDSYHERRNNETLATLYL